MGSVTPAPVGGKRGSIYPRRSVDGSTNSRNIGSIAPTPTAEKRVAFKWPYGQRNDYTNGATNGSIYPSHSEKGGTDSGEMGRITPTSTAENRAAFTIPVV